MRRLIARATGSNPNNNHYFIEGGVGAAERGEISLNQVIDGEGRLAAGIAGGRLGDDEESQLDEQPGAFPAVQDTDEEEEEIDEDLAGARHGLRENLLVARRNPPSSAATSSRRIAGGPNGYTARIIGGKHRRRKQQQQMRLTNRKRHVVVASTNGTQLTLRHSGPHNNNHPTIQAKQNQMYLITTLLPAQCDQQALINRILPKELILRVFSYLDIVSLCRCAQICRFWNKLAMDGSNWQDVDLFCFQRDVKAAVVENLARRCGGFLKVLSLRGCENVQDSALRSFATKCPNIEQLVLAKCKRVTDATCEHLGMYCHKLISLDLENCTAVTDMTMKFLSEGCKKLEELNISWCENITDRGIRSIATGCPKLNSLICKGCEGHVMDESVEDLAKGCNNLEFISLSNCREITDRALVALAHGCPFLKDIELAACTNLTDNGFIALSKNCHELQRMDLEDCNSITDVTLQHLNHGCPNLSSLALSHCELLTDAGLSEFCASHKECIQVLELDNCPLITDAALDYMKPMRNLERVDLYDCALITKEAIKRFKQFRPEVEVQAYFAPATPPPNNPENVRRICRCCVIL